MQRNQKADFHLANLAAQRTRAAQRSAATTLRPLLRVLLAAGLTQQQLIRICERTIGDAAKSDDGVASLRRLPHYSTLEHVIARWANDPLYLEQGNPIRLRIRGKGPSFKSLVKAVAPKSPWRVALAVLTRNRLVKIASDGATVRLVSRFYPMRSHGAIDLELFTTLTEDFLRTHEYNFLKNPLMGRGLFQRVAHKLDSDPRLAPLFNRYVREQGQLFLESVDEWLIRHQPAKKRGQRRRKVRLGVGVYVINEALR